MGREDEGPGGQPRAGGLLLILLSLTPDCSLLQPQRTSEQLPHRGMKLVVCHWPGLPSWFNRCSRFGSTLRPPADASLVSDMTKHSVQASGVCLCVSVTAGLQLLLIFGSGYTARQHIPPSLEASLTATSTTTVNTLWLTCSLTPWQESQHFLRQINI